MPGNRSPDTAPHPGDLKHRVNIGYTKNSINENGYPVAEDVVICRVWAAAVDAGTQNSQTAGVMSTEAHIRFVIRYRSDVKPGMWVEFGGQKWIITALNEYTFGRAYLGLNAVLQKGVSG